jgi:hypothetical protein
MKTKLKPCPFCGKTIGDGSLPSDCINNLCEETFFTRSTKASAIKAKHVARGKNETIHPRRK